MKVHSPNDVATILKIKEATLRKYAILLEKHGYNIERNSQNHRYYQDKDITTLRNVIAGVKNGATLEESVINVVQLESGNSVPNAINNGDIPYKNDIEELKELIHKQNEKIDKQEEFNKILLQKLEEQQKYIESRLNKQEERANERDHLLMQEITERLEAQKQIAVTQEEPEKKGFWNRLFGK